MKKKILFVGCITVLCNLTLLPTASFVQDVGEEVPVNQIVHGNNWKFTLVSYTNTGKTALSHKGGVPINLRETVGVKDKENEVFWKVHFICETKPKAKTDYIFYHNWIIPLAKIKVGKNWSTQPVFAVEISGSSETEPERILLSSNSSVTMIVSSHGRGHLIDMTTVQTFVEDKKDFSVKFDLSIYFSAPKDPESIAIRFLDNLPIVLFERTQE